MANDFRAELLNKIGELNQKNDLLAKSVGQHLNGVYWEGVYGIKYDKTAPAPEVERVGDMRLHKAENLPVHNTLKGCILKDDGTVKYYLDKEDWTKREDGSASNLDGTDGQVMVEFGDFYMRFREEGNDQEVLVAMHSFPGSHYVPIQYIGAYKAALDHENDKLSSVDSNDVKYRGGKNRSSLDGDSNIFKRDLNKPISYISFNDFRTYANNRGERWKAHWYNQRKIIAWLITIEYATRNHQTAFTNNLTAEGYRKGALGNGPTTAVSADWDSFNGQFPAIPCGSTNEIGNNTGVKTLVIPDFVGGNSDLNIEIFRYRGIENFFGDIYEWSDGIMKDVEKVYVAHDLHQDVFQKEGNYIGNAPTSNGYIEQIIFGESGDIIAKVNSGSNSTYFCDYSYFNSSALRAFRFGRLLNGGVRSGSFMSNAFTAASSALTSSGSRLCFIPETENEP